MMYYRVKYWHNSQWNYTAPTSWVRACAWKVEWMDDAQWANVYAEAYVEMCA